MPRLGAHVSIAGGLPLAVDRAAAVGCQTFQLFTKSVGQWRARPLPPDEIREFRRRVRARGLAPVVAHASYLINLATSSPPLRSASLASLGEEVDRAEALGLMGVVLHPGAATTEAPETAIRLVADGLAAVLDARPSGRTRILLEHTAGQGRTIGHRFEQIAEIVDRLDRPARIGVCLDTCHLLAAGYDISTERGYSETIAAFDRIIGFRRLRLLHLNDSSRPCGSRVDRHAHIGQGFVGREGFRRIVNEPRLARVPMVIETPKAAGRLGRPDRPDPFDRRNLRVLRRLIERPGRVARPRRARHREPA
jgi:deoxyribonuclease-4